MSHLVGLGTATAADILSGETAVASVGTLKGTMPNNGALGTYTPTTANQDIPAGYTSGGTVAGDANLIAANILSGKKIFDVAGTVQPRKFASGSATSGNTLDNFAMTDGGSYQGYLLTVSGLAFQPTIVLAFDTTYPGDFMVYQALGTDPHYSGPTVLYGPDDVKQSVIDAKADVSPCSVVNGEFALPVMGGAANYAWQAFG